MRLLICSMSVLTFGCAPTMPPLGSYDAERLSMFATADLCKALQEEGRPQNVRTEIERREIFAEKEIDAIGRSQVYIGMSEDALICSWGRPDDINRSVGSWGVHSQYVYEGGYYGTDSNFVYVENGYVTSWQD